MKCGTRIIGLLAVLLFVVSAAAQIPSGYVQTTSTVLATAKGSFGAAWTNLSSSPQLGLLGCTSTFQTTVNGSIDSYGSFSTLLADTAQICPAPSTWTFTISIPCPNGIPPTSFMLQIPITGGGGTEDISSQITAALPSTICQGGGGGGCNTGTVAGIAQFSDGNGGCLPQYIDADVTNPGFLTISTNQTPGSGANDGDSIIINPVLGTYPNAVGGTYIFGANGSDPPNIDPEVGVGIVSLNRLELESRFANIDMCGYTDTPPNVPSCYNTSILTDVNVYGTVNALSGQFYTDFGIFNDFGFYQTTPNELNIAGSPYTFNYAAPFETVDATAGDVAITLDTITNPSFGTAGLHYWISKEDGTANTVTVNGAAGQQICSTSGCSSSVVLSTQYQEVQLKGNYSNDLGGIAYWSEGGGGGGSSFPCTSSGSGDISCTGTVEAAFVTPQIGPYCDIRSYGWVAGSGSDIGPYVAQCAASFGPDYGHGGYVLLPCSAPSYGTGCTWADPLGTFATLSGSTVTGYTWPGNLNLQIQGTVQSGETFPVFNGENIFGDGAGTGTQFESGTPGAILGPTVNGTLGTDIVTTNAAATITPTFTDGAIANIPPGSAISIAATGTVASVAASRITQAGIGFVTLSLPSSLRTPPGEILTVTGCTDSSFDIANGAVSSSDYGLNTISYYQTDSTPASTSGCTVTAFNDDARETETVVCSNGVNLSGYATCSAGEIVIWTKHTHSSSDQWGEVAMRSEFTTAENPRVLQDLSIGNCEGDCYFVEGGQRLSLNRIGMSATPQITSGDFELAAGTFLVDANNLVLNGSNLGQNVPPCPNGSCPQPSYPYVLQFDASPSGLFYQSYNIGGGATKFGGYTNTLYGGIKIGDYPNNFSGATGLPTLEGLIFEEPTQPVIMVDNRANGVNVIGCGVLRNLSTQDDVLNVPSHLLGYTDPEPPSGCWKIEDSGFGANQLVNSYFNGALISENNVSPAYPAPSNLASSPGVFVQGNAIKGEIEGQGAGLGPAVVPFGSLSLNTAHTYWSSQCGSNCTVTPVVGPDGPSGTMDAAELDVTSTTGGGILIGTASLATYAGDHFIFRSWVRPGNGRSSTTGEHGASNASFYIQDPYGTFATTISGQPSIATPAYFGTTISNNGWYPQVAIATLLTGGATPHNIYFYITAGAGQPIGTGNQFSQPCWAFIPGPNNPSYAGVANDQIEEARQDQYHGNCPPNMAAGVAATSELVNLPGIAPGSGGPNCLQIATTGAITQTGNPCPTSVVSSINGTPGAYTFSFSSGAGSCSGTTCTFTGSGSGGGSVTNFVASSGSWPSWLVPSVATSTTTPTLSVSASAIPNSALAHSTISGIALGNNLDTLTFGAHLAAGASTYNGSAIATLTSDATNANTASTIVARDASGNFSAGTITAALTGTATNATNATELNGLAIPASKTIVGTNSSGQIIDATLATLTNNTSGNADSATEATNLAGTGVDSAPYQSASATTSYITAPTTNSHVFVYAWYPTGSAVAPVATDVDTLAVASAASLSGTPTLCGSGQAAQGILASGNAIGCFTPIGSGTVNAGTAFSPAYYPAAGGTQVSGVAPFNGLAWYQTTAAPAQASGAQVVGVIGSTAVANATNAVNAASAAQINNGTVPASALVLGTNASSQPVAATGPNIVTALGASASTTINGTACMLGSNCSPVIPVTVVTSSTATLGASYNTGLALNENATASQAVTFTLPTPALGKYFCVKNFYNGSAFNTGALTVTVANTGTQKIVYAQGSFTGTSIASAGAVGDYGCFTGVSTTLWDFNPSSGTW